jgi:molecular chaperone DnaK
VPTSIGIDLGTTYSCVVKYRSDGTETVVSSIEGEDLIPSVVHISEQGDVTVGSAAKDLLLEDPDNVIVGIKRHIGEDYPLRFGDQTLTPEGVSALILGHLADNAASALGVPRETLHAIVTIPAYFGVAEREATAAAAAIAGLRCPELLPEPIAAAYAYGLASQPDAVSLVYDLGGGTFDVAIVGLDGGIPRVWAVDGESRLGGLDWDLRVEDLLWAEFDRVDDDTGLRFDDDVIAAVQAASERIKRKLSGVAGLVERIRVAGRTIELRLTRAEFERATHDLLLRSYAAVDRVLEASAAVGAPPVTQFLLVGGSTRMPSVRVGLEERYRLPVRLADPDRAVARGAAILSEQLLAAEESRTIKIGGITSLAAGISRVTGVLTRAVGVLVHDSHDPSGEGTYIQHFLPANSPLPMHRHEHAVATVVPDQERVRIQLFEQAGNVASRREADNRPLIEAELGGIPPGPAGSKVSLHVSVTADGRVRLEASAGDGGLPLVVEAFVHGVLDATEVQQQMTTTRSLRSVR